MAAKKKTKEEVDKEETKATVEEKETPTLEPEKSPEPKESAKEEKKSEEPKTDDSKITSFAQLDTQEDKPKGAKKIITEEVKDEDAKEKKEPESEEETSDEEPKEEKKDDAPKDKDGDEKISSDEVKDWLKDVRPDTTKEVEKSGKPFLKIFLIIIVLLAIGGAVAGGIFYYKNSLSAPTTTEEGEEATSEPTSTATPAPEEADYSDITVSILNGSGVAGEAGNVATLIEEFDLSEPNTGNADSYDYTTTTISLKESVPAELYDSIKEKISEEYIVEKSDTPLEEDSSYDIIIIVGTKK